MSEASTRLHSTSEPPEMGRAIRMEVSNTRVDISSRRKLVSRYL